MGGEVSEWISVEDRLPKQGETVLLFHGDDVFEGVIIWFKNDKPVFFDAGYCRRIDVTHWMPLPEPPKTG